MNTPRYDTPCATPWAAALALLLLCAPGYSQTKSGAKLFQVDDDTAALWIFDQAAASIIDDKGPSGVALQNKTDGEETTVPSETQGKFGKALFFPGGAALVEKEEGRTIETTGQVTFEAWIKLDPSAENTERGVLQYGAPGPSGFRVTIHPNGRLAWSVMDDKGAENVMESEYAIPVDEWVLIAGTYDRETMKMYFNGELVGEQRLENALVQGKGPLFVGLISAQGPPYFRGAIEAIRISKVARTKFDVP